MRSRARAKEIAEVLREKGHSADFYHAGLDKELRSKKQDAWMKGSTRIIVATNAFGMGIDKSNVRLVLHYDVPESIEAYYQEAGRGGRDGNPAYAVLLFNSHDDPPIAQVRIESGFPQVNAIKNMYQALANYLQLPVGVGAGISYNFNINEFCFNYDLEPLHVFNCFKILESPLSCF